MVDSKYIISQDRNLLEALGQINDIGSGPLCLFVVDAEGRMVGQRLAGNEPRI